MMSTPAHCPQCGSKIPQSEEVTHCPTCRGISDDVDLNEVTNQWAAQGNQDGTSVSSEGSLNPGLVDKLLGDYEILEEIARGGMGVVYRARQLSLNRIVALKMVRGGDLASAEDRERFRREAQDVAELDHPHIVPIYEVGEADGHHYFSMKFLEGGTLSDCIQQFVGDPEQATFLMVKLARAVHYAHQRGILHRDLKPGNVLLDGNGSPLIVDFGLAKRIESDASQTRTGAIVGTPAYLSPEQASAEPRLTTATDVYSLGVTFFELLTGQVPFSAPTVLETLLMVKSEEPPRPRTICAQIPADLETICLKCLSRDPDHRYGSADALADDLERWLVGEPITARPVKAWERGWKWVRRYPMAVALVIVSVMAVFALGAFAIVSRAWNNEEIAKTKAIQARRAESDARHVAESLLHLHTIQVAEREWWTNNLGRARELLAEIPPHGRAMEWAYLHRMCNPKVQSLIGHRGAVISVAYSPDGVWMATSSDDSTILLRKADNGNIVATLTRPGTWATDLAFSPDSKTLVSTDGAGGSRPDMVALWDLRTLDAEKRRKPLWTRAGLCGERARCALSPSGSTIAVVGGRTDGPGKITLLASKTGATLKTLKPTEAKTNLFSVCFSADGKLVAAGTGRMTASDVLTRSSVLVWDVQTGELRSTFTGHRGPVYGLAFSPKADLIAAGAADGQLELRSIRENRVLWMQTAHGSALKSLKFSSDGQWLVTCGEDSTLRIWDVESGKLLGTLRGHTSDVMDVAFRPTTTQLASVSRDKLVLVWDASHHIGSQIVGSHRHPVESIALHPKAPKLASVGEGKKLAIWNLEHPKLPPKILARSSAPVRHVTYSHDGALLAYAAGDWRGKSKSGDIVVLDVSREEPRSLWTKKSHPKLAWAVEFSPNGKWLVSGGGELHTAGSVCLRDARTGDLQWERHLSHGIFRVTFSPDGKQIAAAMSHRSLAVVWSTETGKELSRISHSKEEQNGCMGVAFIHSGGRKLLATGGADGAIRIWDPSNPKRAIRTLRGHRSEVLQLAFSAQSNRLVSASDDGNLKLWDWKEGHETLTLRGHQGPIIDVVFSPDGQRLASAGFMDQTARIWDARPQKHGP